MKEHLASFLKQLVEKPNAEEVEEILAIFETVKCAKGEFFKQPFTVSKQIGFLVEGAARTVVYKENGNEVTARIIESNSLMVDIFSLEKGGATPMGIECLAPCDILVAPVKAYQSLLETNLTLNIFTRKYMAKRIVEFGQRFYTVISGTAKERYQFILEHKPNMLKYFPLRLIASMIGITPTQLSRIRNKK